MVFLATILDLGRIYYANISLLNAAREGAFQASKTPDSYDGGQPCNTTTNLIVCRIQLESKGSMVEVDESEIDVELQQERMPARGEQHGARHRSRAIPADHADPRVHLRRPDDRHGVVGDPADRVLPDRRRGDRAAEPVAVFTASDTTGEAPFAIVLRRARRRRAAPTTSYGISVTACTRDDPKVTHVYASRTPSHCESSTSPATPRQR